MTARVDRLLADESRSPCNDRSRVSTPPGPATATCTVPTGLPSLGSGPGDSCRGHTPGGTHDADGALGHRGGDVGVHRADPLDEVGVDAEDVGLGLGEYATTPPRRTSDAPGTSTSVAQSRPPVSDSAVATV